MTESQHPIRAYRMAQEPPVTLQELARKVGISKVSLSRIETGKQTLSPVLARKLHMATGIGMKELCPDLAELFEGANQ